MVSAKKTNRTKGSVGEGESGKKAKSTQHAGGKSVSEKSQVTRTSKNLFEKCDFPLDKGDTWDPITNLPGSEQMITEFQKDWEEEYKIKMVEELQSVVDKRNTRNKKNAKTEHDRNTATDMDESISTSS